MGDWDQATLATIDHAGEMHLAAHRPDGTLRPATIVWHVVLDGAVFVRSVRGAEGAWYRAARRTGSGTIRAGSAQAEVTFTPDDTHDTAIDRAYQAKYGNGAPVRAITSAEATATTLRLDPR